MSRRISKIVGLSAALAALGVAASAEATTTPVADTEEPAPTASGGASTIKMIVGSDLMNFVVGHDERGMVIADHSSHASHASHASHSSHHSGV